MGRILVPRELSTTQLISLREEVGKKLIEFAVKETGKNASEFVIRDALPKTDFGFNSEKWCNQTAITGSTYTKDWTKELPKTKFIAFYGVVNLADTPYIVIVNFKVGANGQTVRDVISISRIRAEDSVKGYFNPVLYKGGETIYVELYTEETIAQYGEALELMALVAEPYGEVISGK